MPDRWPSTASRMASDRSWARATAPLRSWACLINAVIPEDRGGTAKPQILRVAYRAASGTQASSQLLVGSIVEGNRQVGWRWAGGLETGSRSLVPDIWDCGARPEHANHSVDGRESRPQEVPVQPGFPPQARLDTNQRETSGSPRGSSSRRRITISQISTSSGRRASPPPIADGTGTRLRRRAPLQELPAMEASVEDPQGHTYGRQGSIRDLWPIRRRAVQPSDRGLPRLHRRGATDTDTAEEDAQSEVPKRELRWREERVDDGRLRRRNDCGSSPHPPPWRQ